MLLHRPNVRHPMKSVSVQVGVEGCCVLVPPNGCRLNCEAVVPINPSPAGINFHKTGCVFILKKLYLCVCRTIVETSGVEHLGSVVDEHFRELVLGIQDLEAEVLVKDAVRLSEVFEPDCYNLVHSISTD